MDDFLKNIYKIYEFISKEVSVYEKNDYIDIFKRSMKINVKDSFSTRYYKYIKDSKRSGIVYTPKKIADYMVKNLIDSSEVIHNPYIKILDPSCGCGNLIFSCFQYLKEIFLNNINEINKRLNKKLNSDDIDYHILYYNLFGFDIDKTAIIILKIDLFRLTGIINNKNFIVKDFLMDDVKGKFDFIIGNPPYIGHKNVDRNYSKILKKKYKEVYEDKGDVSYCFFSRALKCLNKTGKLGFIISRYFCEASSGKKLRKFILNNANIKLIIDFYGIRPFKDIGIDPIIIYLKNEKNCSAENKIKIIKPNHKGEFTRFFIKKGELDSEGWVIINETERKMLNKIIRKCKFLLSDICNSHQGIITGCDKAFILDREVINVKHIEEDIVKPWIKSSYIHKYKVNPTERYIIYLNKVEEEKYKNSINYVSKYKDKLENRRECRAGRREWYEIQWARKPEIFENEKIVFPYKASHNRFALDRGSYFSADVYCLTLKKQGIFNYEMLLYILNSSIYEFYIKSFAKKLGENLYEYYPNKLMKLKIPYIDYAHIKDTEYLYEFFGFNKREINILENKCK